MRTRLPVRLKLAVVTAALTFGILCLFAVVISAVAEQRIRAGFDDDLRATVADLVNRLNPERNEQGTIHIERAPLIGAGAGDAEVRLLTREGQVAYPEGLPPLIQAGVEGPANRGDYRVVTESGASSPQEMGKLMSLVMPQVKGRADGKRVSAAVKEMLTP